MIKISIEHVDSLQPHALRNISGLFAAIAAYAESITLPANVAALAPSVPGNVVIPTNPASNEAFVKHATPLEEEAVNPPPVPFDVANVPPPVPTAAGIDVDSEGMPWDGRIHAATRAKIGNGTWRQRRNLEPEVLENVTREIRQMMGLKVPSPAAPLPVPVPTPVPVPAAAAAAPNPFDPAPAEQAAAPAPNPFIAFVNKVTSKIGAGQLSQGKLLEAAQSVGLAAFPMLNLRQDLIPAVAEKLGIEL